MQNRTRYRLGSLSGRRRYFCYAAYNYRPLRCSDAGLYIVVIFRNGLKSYQSPYYTVHLLRHRLYLFMDLSLWAYPFLGQDFCVILIVHSPHLLVGICYTGSLAILTATSQMGDQP